MPQSFLSLPPEIRNEIYKFLLVKEEPIDFWEDDYHGLHPNILYTNTKILHEARSILYGQNQFDLVVGLRNSIPLFLDEIGHANASHLEQIRVCFPEIVHVDGNVIIADHSLRTLEKILSYCTNLRTLVTCLGCTAAVESMLKSLNSPTICDDAFALVDAHFRAIPSLQEIAVQVYEDDSRSDIRRKMKSHGWKIIAVRKVDGSVRP